MPWFTHEEDVIAPATLEKLTARLVAEARERFHRHPRRALLLPPDLTRAHSGAGGLSAALYRHLGDGCETHLIPTLGQHRPHTAEENRRMFGQAIPQSRIHAHDWRGGVARVGVIPAALVAERSEGRADWEIPLDLNRSVIEENWDLIVHIGHVVPHEVLGFASHNKNYFIGLGGKETLCASHLAAAAWGIENNLGRLVTPLRACFNWAEEQFLAHLPDVYLLIVMRTLPDGSPVTCGIYVGDDLETYLAAARASRRWNVHRLEQPLARVVAYMQPDEFRSTWVSNKAIYRTRMALAEGGELLVLAPGVERFGEQPEVDALIRRYGYCGTPRVLELYRRNADLRDLGHAAAHLMNGSSEGRFTIRYAAGGLSRAEIEGVNFAWADTSPALERYHPERLQPGAHHWPDGEAAYFVHSPSLGLWAAANRLPADEAAPAVQFPS